MNLGMTLSPLGSPNSNTFKYCIINYAYHFCLKFSPNAYGNKIYASNNNNKIGKTSNMIRKYLTVENTPGEDGKLLMK